jgi:chromosome segregation protein
VLSKSIMLLKSLDLQGYKTFAGKTEFEFAGAITCIVGPNGSGKSNIADSIRWVLGEQSYRLLRGKKTDDMIFAGSEHRPRASMASSTITFDNTNGWLPIDFSEVSITRRAYRDSNNEYLLNGQRVRLRDIAELLGNSGLSERTYTIIGQGLVDATLALKADERRLLFEEAAGIGLYRARRDESHKRLDTTFRNLERVEDIIAELKPRLRSLERQARRAEQYDQVKEDLHMLLRDYYGFHWYRAQQELAEARQTAQVQESMLEAVRREQSELDLKLTAYRDSIQGIRARLGSWHRELSSLHNQRERITRELAVSDERVRSITSQAQNTRDEKSRLEIQLDSVKTRVDESNQEVLRLTNELKEAQAQVDQIQNKLKHQNEIRRETENAIQEARDKLSTVRDKQTRFQTRINERESRRIEQTEALNKLVQAADQADQKLHEAQFRVQDAQKAVERITKLRQNAANALQHHRDQIQSIETERRQVLEARSKQQAELARIQTQLEVIEQADNHLVGYASGAQLLLKSAKKGIISGSKGALSSRLDVPEALEAAVSAALGDYLDAVVFDSITSSDQALDLLNKETTRGAILPMEMLIPLEPIKVPTIDGVIGLAADLVNAPVELRPAIDLLLGQTLIVRDRETARRSMAGQPLLARAVTLNGEVLFASGPIFAGSSSSGTIGRPRQRREFHERVTLNERRVEKSNQQLSELDQKLNELTEREVDLVETLTNTQRQEHSANEAANNIRVELERVERQTKWQKEQKVKLEAEIFHADKETTVFSDELTKLSEEIAKSEQFLRENQSTLAELSLEEHQRQHAHWTTQVAVTERALNDAKSRKSERFTVIQDSQDTIQVMQNRLASYSERLLELQTYMETLRKEETELISKVDKLQALIDPTEAKLDQVEQARDGMRQAEGKARQALSIAERRNAAAQVTLNRKQERLDSMRGRIEDDFGLVEFEYTADVSGPTPLPMGEIVEHLPLVSELPDGLEDTIKRQRAQLRRMGSINPEAQAEYQEVSERFEFMTNQVADLRQAEADIKEVIAELDILMEREFRRTYEAVAAEFRQIFTRLFGGGTARLVLTDPDDLTETGIDIEARLPGRRTQGLSLLSGGERSLTATALVFSLLKVSPTPFCVLDEVDAMLDEANVGRFRDLLRELSQNTQFIVITHNRNTVQAADVIYGVTMGRDSVSQVISLKLDEVGDVV